MKKHRSKKNHIIESVQGDNEWKKSCTLCWLLPDHDKVEMKQEFFYLGYFKLDEFLTPYSSGVIAVGSFVFHLRLKK